MGAEQKGDGLHPSDIKKSLEGKIQKSVVVPEYLTGRSRFKFACHPGIPCFTKCCSGIRIFLSPYDIFRLKKRLGMASSEFLMAHTVPMTIDGSPLQIAGLKMKSDEQRSCPFVTPEGCTVYSDRPLICRYYPVGMGFMKKFDRKTGEDFFIMIKEDHCLGHAEDKGWTIDEWRKDQESDIYDSINHDWLEVVLKVKTLGSVEFSARSLELFFMVSANLDLFRDMAFSERFLNAYELTPSFIEKIKTDELELLKFSLAWLRFTLFGEGDIKVKEGARGKGRERRQETGN